MPAGYVGPVEIRNQRQRGRENDFSNAQQPNRLAGRPGIAGLRIWPGGRGGAEYSGSRSDRKPRPEIAVPHASSAASRSGRAAHNGTGAMGYPVGDLAEGMDMSGRDFGRTLPAMRLGEMIVATFRELMRCYGWGDERRAQTGQGVVLRVFRPRRGGEPALPPDLPRRIRIRKLASFDEFACLEAWERNANDP